VAPGNAVPLCEKHRDEIIHDDPLFTGPGLLMSHPLSIRSKPVSQPPRYFLRG
jgi:hypothetical protein